MEKVILIKPLITEKNTQLGTKLNTYAFAVAKDSNKIEIRKAVEKMYGVKVEDVSTAVMPGKNKQRYQRWGMAKGVKGSMKKAYVTLAKGDTIDFYASV